MIDVKHYCKNHSNLNTPLNFEEAYNLGVYLLDGCRGNELAQKQCIAILLALHNKALYSWKWDEYEEKIHGHRLPKNAAEQIAGICAAIFKEDIGKSQFGFLQPKVPYAIDNCGMGGDLIVTANISTIAAFIAASAEIPMCKHGSPANADEGRHGSSDFIDLCGINRFASREEVERCVETLNFGYTEALDTRYKLIHTQTHKVAKLSHMNDIIGPITNPLDPKKQSRRILGVNHLIPPRIVAEVYQLLNKKGITSLQHGLFIRGITNNMLAGGIDEVSICQDGTQVVELKDGEIKELWWWAKDFGLEPISSEFISPPTGLSKGCFSLAILERKAPKASLQMAAANAAPILYLAGKSQNLKACYDLAEEILMSGKAHQKMIEVRNMIPKT